jgi:hypothetical protein
MPPVLFPFFSASNYAYALGGFNVSNWMGIKRRMIDIGKKITFYFYQNVWKCTDFFAFAFKVCKKCNYDPKNFFLTNINMGIKKRWISCWFQIRWCRLKQMPLKKARVKKLCEFGVFSFLCIFSWFFAFNFCWGHFWKPASTNLKSAWNSAFFWYPYWYFSRKQIFGS